MDCRRIEGQAAHPNWPTLRLRLYAVVLAVLLAAAAATPVLATESFRDVQPAGDAEVIVEKSLVLSPLTEGEDPVTLLSDAPLTLTVEDLSLPTDIQDLIEYLSEGYSQPVAELTLDEAIALALTHNHDLNSKRLSAAAACKGIDVEWSALYPQLSLSAKGYWQASNATKSPPLEIPNGDDDPIVLDLSANPSGNDFHRQLALGLTQRIYDFGLSRDLIDVAEAQHAITKYTVDMAEQQLVNSVVESYYQFNLALGFARIRDDELKLANELLRQAEIQYRVGVVPRLDVIRALSRVEEAKANYIAAQSTVGDAGALFFSLLGVEDQRYVPAVVTEELVAPGTAPVDINTAINNALNFRPELELQYAALDANSAAVRLTGNRPILNAYANAMYQTPAGMGGTDGYEYGVQLMWNLYTGGKDKAAKAKAELELAAINEDIINLESQLELDATTAWNRAMSSRSSAVAARTTLELASEAHRAASIGYSAGVTPYIDYLDALDGNIAAALNYLFKLAEVKMAYANLTRAMGFPDGYPQDSRGGMDGDTTVATVIGAGE